MGFGSEEWDGYASMGMVDGSGWMAVPYPSPIIPPIKDGGVGQRVGRMDGGVKKDYLLIGLKRSLV